MGERNSNMVNELLDFDRSKVRRQDAVISWKAIAFETGVGRSTLQRWGISAGIELPHWGPAEKSPVFLPRGRIAILRTLYFG